MDAPTPVTSGTPFDVTVTALDPYDKLDSNVVVPDDYTFTARALAAMDTHLAWLSLIRCGEDCTPAMGRRADSSVQSIVTRQASG